MMRSTTSWLPKLRPDARPKIVPDRRGRMLVPTPMIPAGAQAAHLRSEGHQLARGQVVGLERALVAR
jgi:hypothetical protein